MPVSITDPISSLKTWSRSACFGTFLYNSGKNLQIHPFMWLQTGKNGILLQSQNKTNESSFSKYNDQFAMSGNGCIGCPPPIHQFIQVTAKHAQSGKMFVESVSKSSGYQRPGPGIYAID
jgi:hypothetical protein